MVVPASWTIELFLSENLRVKIEKLNDWLQVIGLFGIIASLVFVGLEMRQAKQIAMSDANQSRVDTAVGLITTIASDPVLRSTFLKNISGESAQLSPEENGAANLLAYAALINFENIFHQYENGFITDDRWQATRFNIKINLGAVGAPLQLRRFYEVRPNLWSPSFRQLVEDIIREVDSEKAE
jgi:hypothetical protein